eukprot:scaffold261_cov318-Chaetoceros_neogracile.AAC.8
MENSKQTDAVITVLPGDDLSHILSNTNNKMELSTQNMSSSSNNNSNNNGKPIKLGTGILYDSITKQTTATLAGRLHHRSANNTITYYVIANTKRYIPQLNDRILCIVEERMGEYFRVSIPHSSTGSALLSIIAFEGATKRNRPNLKHGDLLYARINTCHIREMEPEITCIVMPGELSGGAAKKDWMTDEGTYGQLKGGSCITVSIGLALELLHPHNVVLEALATAKLPFEICIGVNGLVWVDSERPEYTVLILNAIQNSAVMTEEQVRGMVKSLVQTVKATFMQDS